MPQALQQQYRPPQAEQLTSSMSYIEEMLKKLMADQQSQTTTMRDLERQIGQLANAQNTRPVRALPTTIEADAKNTKELEKPAEEAVAKQPPPLVVRPPPPFLYRLQKVKDNAAYKKFLNFLKQVQINIPLVDILQEEPKYAKYIKDIVANKRRLTEFETVALTEECSSRIQSKLPQKLNDPGVIKNVLVQVVSFIFTADLIILDYKPDQEVPFILGHPFLATCRAIIDVSEGKMTMRVGDRVEVLMCIKHLYCQPTIKSYP
uniref:Uncharacterized protein n=1 Tax=Nicotiana tabacum TaxID=4097 RepID=A0A1S4CG91_TOBAC|nr:PREDICTED: uncharacterized protein LOC107818608 [Nicotiana tabacum]